MENNKKEIIKIRNYQIELYAYQVDTLMDILREFRKSNGLIELTKNK